jgi:trk system potassium uptake protein TrkA
VVFGRTLPDVKIIVVGCGRVGAELAPALERAGHQVTILDKNPTAFRRLPEQFTGGRCIGSGFDQDDLRQAGIVDADALAAVTSGDNTNILTARIAREVFEVRNVVARIYDPKRATIYERLGIPTVATVAWTTEQVMRRLDRSGLAAEWTTPAGEISLVERALPDGWAGRQLDDLTDGRRFRLMAIRRGGATQLADSSAVGQPGDVLYVAVQRDALADFGALFDAMPVAGGHH